MIDEKVKKLIEEFSFNSENKYFEEALYVSKYESKEQVGMPNNKQLKGGLKPNQVLALIGDRVLKLILAQEERNRFSDANGINTFITKKESNKYLSSLNIIKPSHGYSTKDGKPVENRNNGVVSIATMIEAIIGALYLDEFEKTGTFRNAYDFIKKYIIVDKKR